MSDDWSMELWQDGMMVACVSGPKHQALREIAHYAMMYGQDGPVEIREINEGATGSNEPLEPETTVTEGAEDGARREHP